MKKAKLSEEALEMVTAGTFDETGLGFTMPQMDRKIYQEVIKLLEAIGGKWNRKAGKILFTGDPRDALDAAILTGEFTRLDKNGFFPTPPELANEMLNLLTKREGDMILEPSCGDGNLVDVTLFRYQQMDLRPLVMTIVEPNLDLFNKAYARGAGRAAVGALIGEVRTFEAYTDRLAENEDIQPRAFDKIIMNPPFERGQDAKHIAKAIELLKPGGELVAIAGYGIRYRQDYAYRTLREFLSKNGGLIQDNPDGSFKSAGTNVRTVMIYYCKPVASAASA